MSDDRTPAASHLERVRKEAKRWLKQVRAGDAEAIARLRRACPDAPAAPALRDIQHALARERGAESWRHLKERVATAAATGVSTSASGTLAAASREQIVTAFLRAADSGDLATVTELLDRHPDIIDERGLAGGTGMRTALHFAVNGPHEAVIRLLLERGANPNIRCEGDWAYPLHFVAERGRLDLVRLLIEHGADPIGTGDYHELDVIGWATAFEYTTPPPGLVDYLLAHGARHTIFSAVAVGDVEAIRRIAVASPGELARRMDLTNHRRRPLHLAVVKRQPAALAALLDLGADPELLDESSLTPLDQAVLMGELDMARTLIARGAEITLAAAVVLERQADIERLIRKDPEGLQPGHRWGTLIVRASEHASARVIETLIRLGASPNSVDDTKTSVDQTSRYTALHAAAWTGNLGAIDVLLRHGANPRTRDEKYCGTPAGWAAYAKRTEARDRILASDVDIFDAIMFGLPADRIERILAADPGARDRPYAAYLPRHEEDGWHTPLTMAIALKHAEAERVLRAQGAQPVPPPGAAG